MFFPGWFKKSGFFCKAKTLRKKMMVKRKIIYKRGILKQRVFCLFLYHHAIINKHHYSVGCWEDAAIFYFPISPFILLPTCNRTGAILWTALNFNMALFQEKRDFQTQGWDLTQFFFFCMIFSKNIHPRKLHFSFLSPEKLAHLCLLKDFKPSPNCKMIKLFTFDNLFLLLWQSL